MLNGGFLSSLSSSSLLNLVIDSLVEHGCFLIWYTTALIHWIFLFARPHHHFILFLIVHGHYRGSCPRVFPAIAIHLKLIAHKRLVSIPSISLWPGSSSLLFPIHHHVRISCDSLGLVWWSLSPLSVIVKIIWGIIHALDYLV